MSKEDNNFIVKEFDISYDIKLYNEEKKLQKQ